jgi:hypothetical protein
MRTAFDARISFSLKQLREYIWDTLESEHLVDESDTSFGVMREISN